MDAIEKRARELLSAEFFKAGGFSDSVTEACAMRAIIAALTPPDGYVLVPVEPTQAMFSAGKDQCACCPDVWDAMISARPEVP